MRYDCHLSPPSLTGFMRRRRCGRDRADRRARPRRHPSTFRARREAQGGRRGSVRGRRGCRRPPSSGRSCGLAAGSADTPPLRELRGLRRPGRPRSRCTLSARTGTGGAGAGGGDETHGKSLRMLRGTRPCPGQRPASRRRGDGGRCAKRERRCSAGRGTLARLQIEGAGAQGAGSSCREDAEGRLRTVMELALSGSAEPVASAGIASPSDAGAPLPFAVAGRSRNWILPPGTRRISVEKRSESSPSFRHFRVCSLPAT